jgi:hypothetical protein
MSMVPHSLPPADPLPANDRAARPLTGLVSDLLHETTSLLRKEVELAKVEMEEKATAFLGGLGTSLCGGALLFAGVLFLLAAAALGLGLVMPLWGATLVVGAVVALVGWVVLQKGRRNLALDALQPERTLRTLSDDKEWAKRHLHSHGSATARPSVP